MCTEKFQFRKPGAVEQNQRTEKFGRPPPVFFRTSILPYDQQGAQETSKRETAEIQGGFCFEGTLRLSAHFLRGAFFGTRFSHCMRTSHGPWHISWGGDNIITGS